MTKIFETELELSLSRLTTGQLVRTKGAISSTDGGTTLYQILSTGTGVILANGNVAVPYVLAVNENLLINGGFDFWQRGVNFPTSEAEYTVDRWWSGGQTLVAQSLDRPNGGSAYSYELTADTNGPIVRTSVELTATGNRAPFAADTSYTLSGWFNTEVGEELSIFIAFADDVAGLGNSVQVGDDLIANVSGAWQYFTTTFNIGSDVPVGTNTCLVAQLQATTDTKLFLFQMKLEEGTVATPFTRSGNTLAGELALCQRYYHRYDANTYRIIAANRSTTTTRAWLPFPSTMRVTPSLETSGIAADYIVDEAGTTTVSSVVPTAAVDTSIHGCNLQYDVTSGLTGGTASTLFGIGFLGFSAEL